MHPRGRERTRKHFRKKEYVAALLSPGIGRKKLPAEPFLGALPGVSVIELLATESVLRFLRSMIRFFYCKSFKSIFHFIKLQQMLFIFCLQKKYHASGHIL